jgi:hypothetical protein
MLSIIWRVWKLDLFPVSVVEVNRDSYLLGPLEGVTQWRKHAEFSKYYVQRDLRLWTWVKIQVMFIGIYCCQNCLYLCMTDFILRIYVAVTNNLEPSTVIACACMWACAYACMRTLCVCVWVCVCAHACEWVCMCEWQIFIHIDHGILKYCHFSQICFESKNTMKGM